MSEVVGVEQLESVWVNRALCRRVRYRLAVDEPWYFYQDRPLGKTTSIIEYFSDITFTQHIESPEAVKLVKQIEKEVVLPMIVDCSLDEYELLHGQQPITKYFKIGGPMEWNSVKSFFVSGC